MGPRNEHSPYGHLEKTAAICANLPDEFAEVVTPFTAGEAVG
jgi:hypothetical protein